MKLDHITLDNACGEPDCRQRTYVGYTVERGEPACGDGWYVERFEAEPDHVLVYRLNGEHVWPHSCVGCGALIDEESLSRLVTYELTGEFA